MGTWAAPDDANKKKQAKKILNSLESLKHFAYHYLGDDEFFDGLDKAIMRGEEMLKTKWAPKDPNTTLINRFPKKEK